MTVTGYAPGCIRTAQFVNESVYATMPSSALSYIGEPSDEGYLRLAHEIDQRWDTIPGQRVYGQETTEQIRNRFTFYGVTRVGTGGQSFWRRFFAAYALGSSSGRADTLGSFTFSEDVYNGTTHVYNVARGCKVNKLTIHFPKNGGLIFWEADIWAQWMKTYSGKAISDIQNVTIGADEAAPSTAFLNWGGICQINIAGAGLTNFHPDNFKIIIDNHLGRKGLNVLGYNSTLYPLSNPAYEGIQEIIFDGQMISEDQTWHNVLLNNTTITALTIPIDVDTLTLSTGKPIRDAWPQYSNKMNREPAKFKFQGATIA